MDHMEKARKKRIKRYITWAAMAGVVLLLTMMPLLARQEAEADGPVASVLSATAETGDLTASLKGGGTLAASEDMEVNIPTGVKITEFLVKNGDYVTEGTPLARVDKVSVMTAITGVNETLDFLREALEDARDEKVDSTLRATAGGRVKRVFADPGEDVQQVMLRDGCLAILSLDGLMAVKLEAKAPLTTGEAVTVTFGNGQQVEGRVESNLSGQIIVTIEDDSYGIGQTVTVTAGGQTLGSGELYIHNAWKVTAYSGRISTVSARQETTVSQGTTLFTLTDTDYEGQLRHRANQHREYEDLLQTLLTMYRSGTIDAPCDGVISGVDEDSAHLLSGWDMDLYASNLHAGSTGAALMLLSSDTGPTCINDGRCSSPTGSAPEDHAPACPLSCTGKEGCPTELGKHLPNCPGECTGKNPGNSKCDAAKHYSACIRLCDHADTLEACDALTHYDDCIKKCSQEKETGKCLSKKHLLDCIESCVPSDGTKDCPAIGAHKPSCIESCTHADAETDCNATVHYTDCIKKCANSTDASTVCTASKHTATCVFGTMTYKAYVYKVDSVGATELVVYADASATLYTVQRSGSGWAIVDGNFSESLLVKQATLGVANPKQYSKGDIVLAITGYQGTDAVYSTTALYKKGASVSTDKPATFDPSGMTGMGGFNFGSFGGFSMTGGFSGYGSYYGDVPEDEGLFEKKGSTLMTVTPRSTMVLAITLDEQDIAKVQPGMEATVKVEALRGQSFPAQVTKVSLQGTNGGGSSKFTVELTLPAEENMLSGMSATAEIPLDTRSNVLTIPLAALREEGPRTLVCTALGDDGQPTNPIEVKTGLSGTESVEILEGLTAGDTIYYTYYDTLELDTSAEAERFTFG